MEDSGIGLFFHFRLWKKHQGVHHASLSVLRFITTQARRLACGLDAFIKCKPQGVFEPWGPSAILKFCPQAGKAECTKVRKSLLLYGLASLVHEPVVVRQVVQR